MDTEFEGLLHTSLIVIAMGLSSFVESLEQQEVDVVRVDWTPPAGGDKDMADLLEKLL